MLLACGGSDLVLPNDTDPSAIASTGGDGQTGTVGAALADSITVRVTDRQGQPVAGIRVTFAPDASAGGTVSPESAVSDADGRAGSSWVLGNKAGSQTATAVVAGAASLSRSFTATADAGPAQTIAGVSGDNQSAPAGSALPAPLVVIVTDEFGNPVPGVQVNWASADGSVDPAVMETGADGQAATQRTLGPSAGTQGATASASGLAGSPVAFTHTATAGNASALLLVSGNNQTAAPGATLPSPLVVRLVDAGNNPLPGMAVSWIVGAGGGNIAPSGDTDADGAASAVFTLGPTAGATNTVNAVVSGVGLVTFTATATGGGGGGGGGGPSDANSTVSASPTSIQALTGSSTITVTVRDDNGAPVAGASVRLSATGSGNTLTQPPGVTGVDGIATGTLSSSVPGSKIVSATVNNRVRVDQTAEVVVTIAPATTLTIVAGNNQTGAAGSPVPVKPSVKVTNDAGQGIAGFGVTFVVTGGNGSVTGASQTTNSAGVATVGSWVLGDPVTNTLEARATGLNGSPAVFTATAEGTGDAADHLVFQVQPANPQVENQDLAPAVQVAIVDQAGTVVSVPGAKIQLSLTPADGDIDHEKEDARDGVAVFDKLRVKHAGTGFVLTATVENRPELGQVTSNPFDVNGQ